MVSFHKNWMVFLCKHRANPLSFLPAKSEINSVKVDYLVFMKMYHRYRGQLPIRKNAPYYMASSVSGEDKPNRALWLATRARAIWPSRDYPLYSARKSSPNVINPLLTKLVWSSWLDIGLAHFLRVHGPRPISSHLDPTLGQ